MPAQHLGDVPALHRVFRSSRSLFPRLQVLAEKNDDCFKVATVNFLRPSRIELRNMYKWQITGRNRWLIETAMENEWIVRKEIHVALKNKIMIYVSIYGLLKYKNAKKFTVAIKIITKKGGKPLDINWVFNWYFYFYRTWILQEYRFMKQRPLILLKCRSPFHFATISITVPAVSFTLPRSLLWTLWDYLRIPDTATWLLKETVGKPASYAYDLLLTG